jgi:phytoene synthase
LALAYEGRVDTHPALPAFAHTVAHFGLPKRYFGDLITGVEMDLIPGTFGTFTELERYCYLVAGVVGLVCVRIWGAPETDETARLAVLCGAAFQLTNIVRDIREDALRGRLYLPLDDLQQFGVAQDDILALRDTAAVRSLIAFELERARSYYESCSPLARSVPADSRAAFLAMYGIYKCLAEKMEAHPAIVLRRRLRLSAAEKTRIVAASLLACKLGGRRGVSP